MCACDNCASVMKKCIQCRQTIEQSKLNFIFHHLFSLMGFFIFILAQTFHECCTGQSKYKFIFLFPKHLTIYVHFFPSPR